MKFERYIYQGGVLLAFVVVLGICQPMAMAQSNLQVPKFKVDPYWPKPLPATTDANGEIHQWVTGQPGGTCVDSHDNIYTFNRGWQPGPLGGLVNEGDISIATPPIVEFDSEGNIVNTWGNTEISPPQPGVTYGVAAVLPASAHGCFVDYQGNVWLAGIMDGVVQKWTPDGKRMLLQIGTKGVCDGPNRFLSQPRGDFSANHPTCAEPGYNSSHTLLDEPADLVVDPGPDPVTGQRDDVYIADGYGNYRVVVFDSNGKYLRQMGSPGSGPGQFVVKGGGHPHCVALGIDNLVYACDRGQNRIEVFDKMGNFVKTIPVDPPTAMDAKDRATNMKFSRDKEQTWMYVTDIGTMTIWIMNRRTGQIVGHIGHAGRMAGELAVPHTLTVDSKGNIYESETLNGGRRTQKFVLQNANVSMSH